MSVRVEIVEGPLVSIVSPRFENAGAVVMFEGVVRGLENGSAIEALFYEAYRPMADRQLERLAQDLCRQHAVLAIDVMHSVGRVAVGEISFRLIVASAHRKAALAAMDEFIDRMKQDVPIWKRTGA
jgi:molybdopterin synthase catalytic subunit